MSRPSKLKESRKRQKLGKIVQIDMGKSIYMSERHIQKYIPASVIHLFELREDMPRTN